MMVMVRVACGRKVVIAEVAARIVSVDVVMLLFGFR